MTTGTDQLIGQALAIGVIAGCILGAYRLMRRPPHARGHCRECGHPLPYGMSDGSICPVCLEGWSV